MSSYRDEQEFEGFRCICGELVVVMHTECRALLTPEQIRRLGQ